MLKITVLEDTYSSLSNSDLAACVTSSRRGVPFQQFMLHFHSDSVGIEQLANNEAAPLDSCALLGG